VYAIVVDDATKGSLHIAADKIVGGKREPMGVLTCRFQAIRQQLLCPMGEGQWQFRWDGEMLVGGLIDRDGAFRFVQVSRRGRTPG
jgi:hypothetical protein